MNLPNNHKDYQDVEAAFHKTARNQIDVRIERIQNKEIFELKCKTLEVFISPVMLPTPVILPVPTHLLTPMDIATCTMPKFWSVNAQQGVPV